MVMQLIYMSQPFGYDSGILSAILTTARRKNTRHGITGALICRQDIYLQLLEGDHEAIDLLWSSISTDDRHLEITVLSRAEKARRVLPNWAMLHDPARSWLWSPEEVGRGAVGQATQEVLEQVFERAAYEAVGALSDQMHRALSGVD